MKQLIEFLKKLFSSSGASDRQDYTDLSPKDFKETLQRSSRPVLIDVRTPEEIAQGHLQGAEKIDYRSADFEQAIESLERDKSYFLYCRSGNRSGKACQLMASKGFKSLYNMEGGFIAWKQSYPSDYE